MKMKSFRQNPNIPSLLRRALLSWLIADTIEYLLLPGSCRRLDGLHGPARMSESRVMMLMLLFFSVFSFLSRKHEQINIMTLRIPRRKSIFFRGTLQQPSLHSAAIQWAHLERLGILFSFVLLATASLWSSFSFVFFAACCLVSLLLVFYAAISGGNRHANRHAAKTETTDSLNKRNTSWKNRKTCQKKNIPQRSKKTGIFLWVTILLSILFFLLVSVWTLSRVYCFSTPTFDFAIFSQMFHYMKATGFPYTTLERDRLLSHFHVHISPIYYLLLPFYCLAPVPATLQILQAAVITSAVIPLWKLGRHYGLTPFQQMLICALLLLYPAFSGGVGYDIHENCFLTPLLLWLFYGIAKRNSRLIAATALLTMLVKEDAPVYVACTGLWLLTSSLPHHDHHPATQSDCWGIIAGSGMQFVSLAYFFAASGYLSIYGDGLMTARYSNFITGTASPFISLMRTVLLCPMKVVYECADTGKLWFIAITILPLLGLPLLTRRWERYLLLIPYVLINLMPDYSYQHDIFFQYVFGSTACLLYLTVMNLADLQMKLKRPKTDASADITLTASALTTTILTVSTAVCAACFAAVIVPKAISYPSRYISSRDDYQELSHTLSQIPDEASVTASAFYTTFLSQRSTLYDIHYASREHLLSTEFVVLDPASENDFKQYARDGKTGYEGLVELLNRNGYQLYAKLNKTVEIYRRKKPS